MISASKIATLAAYLVAAVFAGHQVIIYLSESEITPDSAYGTQVTRVVDGDTIVVRDANGREEKVRIIGINTPETVDPRREVGCYGPEASARAKELLEGQTVELTPDATQDEADRYGRLLRYVTLPDGTDFGHILIEEGYAYEYTYKTPYERQSTYRVAEDTAEFNAKGIWSDLCIQ